MSQINNRARGFLKGTLWIWLPFAVLRELIKDLHAKHDRERSAKK